MKTILRKISIYTFALFILPSLIPGVSVNGGLETIFIGGAALALMFLVVKPILNIISFPVNLLTLGLFSIIINGLILYLVTLFISELKIGEFGYPSLNFLGFVTPAVDFNIYFAYIFTAFVISLIVSSLSWLME